MTQVEPVVKKWKEGYLKQTNKQKKALRTHDVCACSVCGTHFGTLQAVRSAITGLRLKSEFDGKIVYQHPDPAFCNKVIEMRKKIEEERVAKLAAAEIGKTENIVAEIGEYTSPVLEEDNCPND